MLSVSFFFALCAKLVPLVCVSGHFRLQFFLQLDFAGFGVNNFTGIQATFQHVCLLCFHICPWTSTIVAKTRSVLSLLCRVVPLRRFMLLSQHQTIVARINCRTFKCHEIMWNATLMQQGNFVNVLLARGSVWC